jgi:O-6-methylguanine DNA methyltransferase
MMPETVAIAATAAAPWGSIHIAATDAGVVAIDLLTPPDVFAADLERRLAGHVRRAADTRPGEDGRGPAAIHLAAATDAVGRFFDGDPDAFEALVLDLADRPAWDRAVLEAVRRVPRGSTASYGDIARAIGRPGAARAVGGAVGRNPVSLAIPCHRVIAGDGTLGGYGGGWWGSREERLALKRDLLAREGIAVPIRGVDTPSAR